MEEPLATHERPFAHHWLLTLALRASAALVSYGFVLVLSNTLDGAAFGQVTFFLSLAALLGVVAGAGIPPAVLRESARFFSANRPEAAAEIITAGACRVAVFGFFAAVSFAGALFGLSAWGWLAGFSGHTILIGALVVPLWTVSDLLAHAARAKRKMVLAVLPREIAWRGIVALIMIVAMSFAMSPSAELVLWILVLSLLIVLAWQLKGLALAPTRPSTRSRAKGNLAFWLNSVVGMIIAQADILLVAVMLGAVPAGQYFVANRLAQMLSLFQTASNQALAPDLASASQNGPGAVAGLARQASFYLSLPMIAGGAVLVAFAPDVLALFGPSHRGSAPILLPLVLGAIFNAMSGPTDLALLMADQEKRATLLNLAVAAAAPLVMFAALQSFGPVGLAWSCFALSVFRKSVFWHAAHRHFGQGLDAISATAKLAR